MNELIELGPLEKILDNMSSLTEHNVRTNLTSTDGKPLTEEEIQEISSYKGKPIRVVFSYHNFHPQPLLIVVVRRIGATEGPTYSKYSLRMIDGEIIPYQDDPANYFNEGSPYRSEAKTNAGNTMVFNEAHFSLTKISELLSKNGFLIKSMVESKQVPEKGMLLPKYLAFECVLEKQPEN